MPAGGHITPMQLMLLEPSQQRPDCGTRLTEGQNAGDISREQFQPQQAQELTYPATGHEQPTLQTPSTPIASSWLTQPPPSQLPPQQNTNNPQRIAIHGLLNDGNIEWYSSKSPIEKMERLGIFSETIQDSWLQLAALVPEDTTRNIMITIRVDRKRGYQVIEQLGLETLQGNEEEIAIDYTNALVEKLALLGKTLHRVIQCSSQWQEEQNLLRTRCVFASAPKDATEGITFTIEADRQSGFMVITEFGLQQLKLQ